MAARTGTAFAMLDYAGHGKHKVPLEQSTHKQQLDEVTAIYDELIRLGYKKIISIGGSFGGYMAGLLSAKRPLQAIILRAPANYPDDQFELPYGQTQPQRSRPLDSSATRAIGEFDGFVYVLEHELDEVVPREIPRRYFEVARKGNYLIIPSTKHSPKLMKNPQRHYEYIELMITTLVEAVKLQAGLSLE
jgi:pimeloyl-ACP methyl ester carboxylesterase